METELLKYPLVGIGLACFFLLLNQKNLRILRRLAPSFGGALGFLSPVVPTLNGLYQSLRISIHLTPKFSEVRGTLKVRLHIQPVVRMRVLSGVLPRWAGKSGMFHPVSSGDPAFDALCQVFAAQETIAGSFVRQEHVRRDVMELFGYGFSLLGLDRQDTWAEKTDYDRTTDLDLRRLRVVFDILHALASGVPRRGNGHGSL